jgi:beta-N-acetylhexosaminidase
MLPGRLAIRPRPESTLTPTAALSNTLAAEQIESLCRRTRYGHRQAYTLWRSTVTKRRCKALVRRGGIVLLVVLISLISVDLLPAQLAFASSESLTIDEQIDRMSTDERIAQLMIVSVSKGKAPGNLERIVAGWRVGGLVLYGSNLRTVTQVRELTTAIRDARGPVPPFIAVDQEGGIVRRLPSGPSFVPSHMALGATGSAELARRAGFATGTALRNLGFTMNFAPVLDVLPESGAAELATRALSSRPQVVAQLGIAFIEGQRAAGIISVGKHFPGQGRAIEDTHRVLPVLDVSLRDLDTRDLLPFRLAIERGLSMIMTGHVALPRITGRSDLPATVSDEVMTKILRTHLRFDGVVISDALQMKALSSLDSAGNAAVQAVLAGCDMVLVPGRPQHGEEVFNGLRRAYRDGTLSDARLRESLRRILTLKAIRLDEGPPQPIEGDIEREIARKAVTVIGDREILVTALREGPVYVGPAGQLHLGLGSSPAIILPPRFNDSLRRQLREQTTRVLAKASAWIAVAQTDEQWQFIDETSAAFRDLPMVYVNLGSPYRSVDGRQVVSVLTYSSSIESQRAAVDVIKGIAEATGVLPITLAPGTSSGAGPDKHLE